DWQGGGRAPAANCGGRQTAAVTSGQSGADLGRPGGGGGMRVRFTTKAGPHQFGVTFLQTNFAPVLGLGQHFQRDTMQTGATPGFTYFPHGGTVRIEGPFNAKQAVDSPSRKRIFVCRPATAAEENACATRILSNLASKAYRRPATATDTNALMEF